MASERHGTQIDVNFSVENRSPPCLHIPRSSSAPESEGGRTVETIILKSCESWSQLSAGVTSRLMRLRQRFTSAEWALIEKRVVSKEYCAFVATSLSPSRARIESDLPTAFQAMRGEALLRHLSRRLGSTCKPAHVENERALTVRHLSIPEWTCAPPNTPTCFQCPDIAYRSVLSRPARCWYTKSDRKGTNPDGYIVPPILHRKPLIRKHPKVCDIDFGNIRNPCAPLSIRQKTECRFISCFRRFGKISRILETAMLHLGLKSPPEPHQAMRLRIVR